MLTRIVASLIFTATAIPLALLATPSATQTDNAQCQRALAFAEMQDAVGVDIANYNREEIQWLLAYAKNPSACTPVPEDLLARMRGEYPLPKHHRRMNCHIAMDFLLDANERGEPISEAEREWAGEYIDTVENGELCNDVPRALLLRATGHTIVGSDMKPFLASAMDDADDSDAMLEIGMAYFFGTLVSKDIEKGYSYLISASEKGNAWANLELANLYRAGKVDNVPRSSALEYAMKAADAQNAIGYLMVADLYYTGDVIKKNRSKAVEYYLKAAERGELSAVIIAANLLFDGDGVKKDRKRAYELALNAAHTGDTNAMVLIASMMLRDKNVAKNEGEVWYWLNRASEGGNAQAASFLAEKREELERAFVLAKYVPPKRVCVEVWVCDVYGNSDGSQRSKICAPQRNWASCDYSL